MPTEALTDEQQEIRELIRELARERIAPRAAEIDKSAEFPWDVVELFREHGIFGVLYDDIEVDTNPIVAEPDARRVVEAAAGVSLGAGREGELVVLPRDTGSYALTWWIRAATGVDVREYFVDAHSGRVIFGCS